MNIFSKIIFLSTRIDLARFQMDYDNLKISKSKKSEKVFFLRLHATLSWEPLAPLLPFRWALDADTVPPDEMEFHFVYYQQGFSEIPFYLEESCVEL